MGQNFLGQDVTGAISLGQNVVGKNVVGQDVSGSGRRGAGRHWGNFLGVAGQWGRRFWGIVAKPPFFRQGALLCPALRPAASREPRKEGHF